MAGKNQASTFGKKAQVSISDAMEFTSKFMHPKPLIKTEAIRSDFNYLKLEPVPYVQQYEENDAITVWDFDPKKHYSLKIQGRKSVLQKECLARIMELYEEQDDPYMRNLVFYAIA